MPLGNNKTETGSNPAEGEDGFLGRDAWIDAGIELLIADGVDQVKITRLADMLGVTRGSFYWHFKDRGDLLSAILEFWEGRNTKAIVDAVSGAKGVEEGILSLFQVWIDHGVFDPEVDAAIRAWGNNDPDVKEAVRQADAVRIESLRDMYARDGYRHPDCFIRARILYFSQVGYFALETARQETREERKSYIEAYFRAFTGRELDPDVAAEHREHAQFKEKHG